MAAKTKIETSERADDRGGRHALPVDARSRQIVRAVLALALIALAAWIAADFLPALAWAIVIAITTWPLYLRFAALIPPPLRRFIAPAGVHPHRRCRPSDPADAGAAASRAGERRRRALARRIAEKRRAGARDGSRSSPSPAISLVEWWQSESQRSAGGGAMAARREHWRASPPGHARLAAKCCIG